MDSHMKVIVDKVRTDIIAYKKEHSMGDSALAEHVGVFQGQISKWRNGDSRPLPKSIEKLIKAGVTDVRLPEVIRQQAITRVLERVDNGNTIPRSYRKRVSVPPIISNQVKLLIDDYMCELEQPATWVQFTQLRDELIRKVYYLCRQG